MKIFIGSDHGGYELKKQVVEFLKNEHEVIDLGCDSADSVDYPAFGRAVAEAAVADPDSRGIVCCGSGVGIGIAANKVQNARCVTANSVELAILGRQHNGAQILSMGERTQWIDPWTEIVTVFLKTDVDQADRHENRRCQLG